MNLALVLLEMEWKGFLRDKRAVLVNFLIPVLTFPLFLFLLAAQPLTQKAEAAGTTYRFDVVGNSDPQLRTLLDQAFPPPKVATEAVILKVIFPPASPGPSHGTVEIQYSSTDGRQVLTVERLRALISDYGHQKTMDQQRAEGIDPTLWKGWEVKVRDLAPEVFQKNEKTATILPYIIVLLLMISGMGIGLDVTAGEKERGGLLLLLSNSVPRSSIVVGKTLFVMTCSMANGMASCAGLVCAVAYSSVSGSTFSLAGPYGVDQLLVALLLITVTGSLFASLIVLIGSWSSTSKEAAGYSMPFNLLVILVATLGTQLDGRSNGALGWVPFLNFFAAFKDLLVGRIDEGVWITTCSVNVALTAVVVALIARLYRSERILR